MTTTPTLWLGAFQANIIDGPGGNQAATNEQSNVHVVGLTGGRFLVAWEDFSTVQGGLEPPDVTGRIFDAFGAPMGGQIYLSAAYSDLSQRLPDIAALSNGGFLAAYQTTDAAGANDLENITVEVFDAAGNRVRVDDFRQGFGGPAGVNDTNPTLTSFANGSYVLFYSSDAFGPADLIGHIVSSAGAIGPAFIVDGDPGVSGAADSARLSNGDVVVAYQHTVGGNHNIRFGIRTATGAFVVGGPVAATPNAETAPAVAALTGGGFVVVWEEANGNGAGVAGLAAKIYSNVGGAGASLDSSIFAPVATAQTKPTVAALADGGFVLGWTDAASGDAKGMRFDAAGATVGTVFTVPDFNTADGPSFALLDDGRFVAALTNTDGTGDKDILVSIHDPRTSPINGTANADILTSRIDGASVFGFGGEDKLHGFAGNDRLDGGGGNDEMTGGGGNDLFIVDSASDKTFETAGGGSDHVLTTVSYTLTAGQEIEIFTPFNTLSNNAIDLTGNELANRIGGNQGANRIDGGVGADNMFGYGANDLYIVDNTGDRVNETIGGGALDMVLTKINYTLTAGQEIEIFTPFSTLSNNVINLTGNEFANRIGGNQGANRIDGGVGADNMFGYGANDLYIVDNTGDRVNEAIGGGALDMVLTKIDYTLTAGQEIEVFTPFNTLSDDAIDLTGNEFANRIGGNQGVNRIDGGGGADILFGYGGDDVFVFRKGQANGDAVQDFVGNGGAVGDSFEFIGYGADATFTIIDATHWQINYNAGASHEVITIANGAAINASDYTFV